MRTHLPAWATVLLMLAAAWHVITVVAPPEVGRGRHPESVGKDYASYHYAVQVAAAGGDPYDTETLSAAAQADGTRSVVNPFYYPPPFLVAFAWALPLELETGYRIAYWLDELCLLLAMLALWRWWRPLGAAVPVAIVVGVAALPAIVFGHSMGQINGLVLALVVSGLWQTHAERPGLGGALLGAACMLKMSPALFVAWWLLQRRWRAAVAAIVTAVLLSVLALTMVDFDRQLRFYTEVLPSFGSGDYNGLGINIGVFVNHSLPNLVDQLLPGDGKTLSPAARIGSAGLTLGLVGVLGWTFRRPVRDLERVAAQVSAVAIAALLIPVFTYEHHLVSALPATVCVAAALVRGRLPRWAWLPGILAMAALCWPHRALRRFVRGTLEESAPLLAWCGQEAKTAALLTLLVMCCWLGVREPAREPAAGG